MASEAVADTIKAVRQSISTGFQGISAGCGAGRGLMSLHQTCPSCGS
ncbi:hypothetical protein DVU_2314 [Nitratidesulfovibrio vulgaris str. Hildenborough]|uniref:Uncharacterized protein n=1 Tax=Nitratidesulfovibrio vulgaris (strain ATCC 29579 / DSM 644 / CCUG 34227 / NCIMB 8303 / VKM B-1760 / Hildenborough) TaxID=882 RepID=Q729N6_NITV2|nr:hypothetical protein DVU_2314 [Nitratidesulfovibrio vulgaris str. Hildenborough]